MMQPFKAGDRFADHAKPISEVMSQLTAALGDYQTLKRGDAKLALTEV